MKTIIAGGRECVDYRVVSKAMLQFGEEVTEVVSGCARGADTLGEQWARNHSIPIKRFPADWDKHGRGAGYIRNKYMANYADALVALWDGVSRGTANMIEEAKKKGLVVFVYRYDLKPVDPYEL